MYNYVIIALELTILIRSALMTRNTFILFRLIIFVHQADLKSPIGIKKRASAYDACKRGHICRRTVLVNESNEIRHDALQYIFFIFSDKPIMTAMHFQRLGSVTYIKKGLRNKA